MSSDSTAARRTIRAAPFDIKPLLFANMACTMAMMAFVAVVAPVARVLGLQPWQAGATVTVSGALWMLMARVWGTASDRRGRRPVLLLGVAGVCVSYAAMCLAIDASLRVLPSVALAFLAIVLTRGAVGLFYGSIPAIGQALIADHVPPHRRAGALASFGAAGAMGLVLGPAAAAWLAQFSLSAPLYGMAGLPFLAWLVLWRALPKEAARAASGMPSIRLADARLRRPMAVAFVAMFGVGIAQITVGFYALDRLGLEAAAAARVAGIALTLVGVALVLSQMLVRRLALTPQRMIRIGGVVAACGFGCRRLGRHGVGPVGLLFRLRGRHGLDLSGLRGAGGECRRGARTGRHRRLDRCRAGHGHGDRAADRHAAVCGRAGRALPAGGGHAAGHGVVAGARPDRQSPD